MSILIYTKNDDSCSYCHRMVEFCKNEGIDYIEKPVDSDTLKEVCKNLSIQTLTFPQVFGPRGEHYGGFEAAHQKLTEPILQPDTNFTLFPIVHHDVFDLYRKAVASFWVAEEIDLSKDAEDLAKMNDNEKHFIMQIIAFFAGSDGIVNENLARNFLNEVGIQEAKSFYSYQIFNESIHSHTYSLLIDTYIKDEAYKTKLFNAIYTIPSVQKKAQWCMKWIKDTSQPFSKRLIAFALVEGLFFSGAFCSIFWLKKRGLMPGLSFSNELISRDEGLHQDHAVLLFSKLQNKPLEADVKHLFQEAVDHEVEFICDSIPCNMIGMNQQDMTQYIKFVADRLLMQLGYSKMYHVKNPFPFMENISLEGKTNFFEKKVGEYQRMVERSKREVNFDEECDF